jgi:glycosyltransferase involved in cell wall biosynthesis
MGPTVGDARASNQRGDEKGEVLPKIQTVLNPPCGSWGNASGAPDISVVIPVYNEEENLRTLYSRLTGVLTGIGLKYEIVFVDDGSDDQSPSILLQLATEDACVMSIRLARNFGHQAAISAGLDYSRGGIVSVMDADLQDPPEVLPQFINKLREGYDVVYAIREQRKEGWLKCLAYATFYKLLQRISNIQIPLDAGDFCVMDRRVVDLLVSMPERNRFVRSMRSWVGFSQVGLPYERHVRYAGQPKYTVRQLIYLALDGLVSFSYMPLRAITILGFTVSLLSLSVALFYFVKKLTYGIGLPGFTTLVVAIFFLAGIQLMTIGVIGEYVGRISEEVKQRPLYIVRQVTKRQPPSVS